MSPFAATFALPLEMESTDSSGSAAYVSVADANLPLFFGHLVWSLVYNGVLLLAMIAIVSGAVARGGVNRSALLDDRKRSRVR